MPVIYRERGFRYSVKTNDHEPAHVHVETGGGDVLIDVSGTTAKIRLIRGRVADKAANQILDIADANLAKLQQGWEKYHGSVG